MLYLVIQEDRHTDVEVRAFTTAEAAVSTARVIVESYADPDDDEQGHNPYPVSNCLYYGRYSSEGDSVRVVACELEVEGELLDKEEEEVNEFNRLREREGTGTGDTVDCKCPGDRIKRGTNRLRLPYGNTDRTGIR
ncbi:MAG: hypothetical protein ACXABY_01445 [Candidatus Thorarchaeota archaeon]